MPTNPGAIAPPPLAAPDPGDKATFASRMSSLLTWLRTTLYTGVNTSAQASYTNATEAAAFAQTAIDAAAGVSAPAWTSGTYTVGTARYSPINQLLYRCILAGSSTTDPSADPTRWKLMADEFTEVIVTGSTHTAAHRTTIKIRTAGACTVTMPTLTNGFRCDIKVENGRMDNVVNWGGAGHEDSTDATMLLDDPYEFIKITGSNVWRIST